jgi:hypothetical protein
MGEKFILNGIEYEFFGDDPEEFKKLMDPDGDGVHGIRAKQLSSWIPRIPKEVRKIPTEEQKADIIKLITGYGIWYLTHYGAHLIELICKPCAMVFSAAVKFRTGIKQERIPFLEKLQ